MGTSGDRGDKFHLNAVDTLKYVNYDSCLHQVCIQTGYVSIMFPYSLKYSNLLDIMLVGKWSSKE